ncbi:hypothetical protein [Desulfospira joergensenii]|uniref:hypothetical protein n=1 Tax=Desulfospira joergensenii TaxID=53329 RepID=UPI0003B726B2|nr:hypothetical protein [Desulfospira joergensenii]
MQGVRWVILFLAMVLSAGCNTFYMGAGDPVSHRYEKKEKGKGPPPHAPAHGYRHKHQGYDLEYRDKAGAYIVLNVPETWFYDDLYIRVSSDGEWFVSADLEGGWRIAAGNEVPYSLKEYKKKGRHKKKKSHKKKK